MNMRLHTYMLNNNISEHRDINVYKTISKFFSFSPDIFCLLPKHRLVLVGRKVEKWEQVYKKTNSKFIRSMCYGIIIHFSCDFATAPHNFTETMDLKSVHQKYERKLTKNRNLIPELHLEVEEIADRMWNNYKDCSILDGLSNINKEYRNLNEANATSENPINTTTMIIDYLYASVMCEYVCRYLVRDSEIQRVKMNMEQYA